LIRDQLSFQEIYNSLLAGKKLVLHFQNATVAETFRTRLAHQKSKQDQTLENLGMAIKEDRAVLSFKPQGDKDGATEEIVAYVQFTVPPELKKYPVIILEEADLAKV
jgi:hypothetical protein